MIYGKETLSLTLPTMSRLTEAHKQQLKVRETQMELGTDNYVGETPLLDDFEGKLEQAQQQLETLQAEQERLERQKLELAELNERKEEFLKGQTEVSEKLSSAITAIERGLFEIKQETEDLEQTRTNFAEHLQKIDQLNPESWTRDNLKNELNRAISAIDLAEDEYDQAVDHIQQRDSAILNSSTASKPNALTGTRSQGAFATQFKAGLAFNLPLMLFGTVVVLIYLAS